MIPTSAGNAGRKAKDPRKRYNRLPSGWRIDKRANAPIGYVAISNNKSRFGGQRKSGILRIAGSKRSARASST